MTDNLYSSLPDEMLVRLLSTGDEKAYETIYLRYWRPLYSVAVWKIGDAKAAEELVQELFMQLWENRQKTLIGHLEAYLKTALRYRIITFIKDRGATSSVEFGDAPELPSDLQADTGVGVDELSMALQQALKQLPEKTRLIFQMSRFEQLPTSDIAKYMKLTERAVEYHITQSLRLLRLHLRDYLPYATILFSLFL